MILELNSVIKNHTDFIPEEEVWSQEYYGEVLSEIYRPHNLPWSLLEINSAIIFWIPLCHDEWTQP
jgi:hypothetical protein